MNKAILVMDMPDKCWKCSACACSFSTNGYWCCAKDKDVDPDSKPDWCPLRPVPEKYGPFDCLHDDYGEGFSNGYNACIDEILGE